MTPFFKPYLGGTEIVLDDLKRSLAASLGAENVAVLTSRYAFPWKLQPDVPARETDCDGVVVDRSAVLRSLSTESNPEAEPVINVQGIKSMVDDFEPTIIHWIGGGWHEARAAALDFAGPTAAAVWSPLYIPQGRSTLRTGIPAQELARRASALTFQTGLELQAFTRHWGIESDRLSLFRPRCDRLPLEANKQGQVRLVMCVGRIGAHKGQFELVKQWDRIRTQLSRPTKLILIGEDEGLGPGVREIAEFIEAKQLQDDVVLTGWQNERQLAEWYSQATVFASMSKIESYGISYCEALRAGVPVLTWDTGPVKEVVGRGGIAVPRNGSPDDFGNALLALVENERLLANLGREARLQFTRTEQRESAEVAIEVYDRVSASMLPTS